MNLFDFEQAKKNRDVGMALAADRSDLLGEWRRIALEVALKRADRRISIDDVGREVQKRGLSNTLGNAAGSLFKERHWHFTGDRINSKKISSHAREIKVWKLIE